MMLKEDWKSSDKLKEENLIEIADFLKELDEELGFKDISFQIEKGCFLFCEYLQQIEKALEHLSIVYSIDFDYKEWNNLTTISYLDLNRWGRVGNIASEKAKKSTTYIYNKYVTNKYQDLIEKTYKELLNKEIDDYTECIYSEKIDMKLITEDGNYIVKES